MSSAELSRSLTSITVGRIAVALDDSARLDAARSRSACRRGTSPSHGLAGPNERGSWPGRAGSARAGSGWAARAARRTAAAAGARSPRRPGREHLVGHVREDDEADAGRGLRERAEHALDALVLARLDARRDVEDDHAAAAGGEVARRPCAEPSRRRARDRGERAPPRRGPVRRASERPPGRAGELADGGRRKAAAADGVDHAGPRSWRRARRAPARRPRPGSAARTTRRALARGRPVRRARRRRARARLARSAFRRSGESPLSAASRASCERPLERRRAGSSGVLLGPARPPRASQPPRSADAEQRRRRGCPRDEPQRQRAWRPRVGDRGQRRHVGTPASRREGFAGTRAGHLERRPVDDRGARPCAVRNR